MHAKLSTRSPDAQPSAAGKQSSRWVDREVDIKIKISALWISMLFVFAYIDIFGFFRADVLNDALIGKISVFEVSQSFFIYATLYILIPSAMVFLSLVMQPALSRVVNIAVSVLYAVSIVLACLDEMWVYFLFGSLIEIVQLGLIVFYAWCWPREPQAEYA